MYDQDLSQSSYSLHATGVLGGYKTTVELRMKFMVFNLSYEANQAKNLILFKILAFWTKVNEWEASKSGWDTKWAKIIPTHWMLRKGKPLVTTKKKISQILNHEISKWSSKIKISTKIVIRN